jgi:hypothetical protein
MGEMQKEVSVQKLPETLVCWMVSLSARGKAEINLRNFEEEIG